jgi:hypothetical protein
MNHLPYDALNGSLVEQDHIYVVGNKEPPCEEINQLAIGDIRPQEDLAKEVEDPQVAAAPNSADNSDAVQLQTFATTLQSGSAVSV